MSRREGLTATVEQEGSLYVAKCVELGTVSQGISVSEALKNLREATELYIEEAEDQQATEPIGGFRLA